MATQKQARSGARGRDAGPRANSTAGKAAARTRQPGKASQAPPGTNAKPGKSTQAPAQPARPGQNGKAARAGSSLTEPASPSGSLWRRLTGYAAAQKLEFSTLVISVLGLGVSVYLTIEEFTANSALACPDTGAINCAKVLTSAQSHVFGIPVAVLGLAFFVFMVPANTPWGWQARQPALHWLRLGSVIVGICFVLYLVYAELFLIGAICLYCTSVHVLTFLLFALIVSRATLTGLRASPART